MATPVRYRIRQSPLGRRLPHGLARFYRVYHYALNGHISRRVKVARYLRSTDEPRLQLGSGPNVLEGWLNSDVVNGEIFVNVTRRLPVRDSAFAYVYSEHMIEHISEEAGIRLLGEIHRALRPGGVFRVTTPDLQKVISIYEDDNPVIPLDQYLAFLNETLPNQPHPRAAQMLNTYMRAWGHQYVYDEEDLRAKLTEAGFAGVVRLKEGESSRPLLQGLESHEPAWSNPAEAMCLEAVKR